MDNLIEWKNGYYVDCSGNAYKLKSDGTFRELSTYVGSNGYKKITVWDPEKQMPVPREVHRIMIEAVHQKKLDRKISVHHIDENKLNNSIWNLMIMDAGEHIREHNKKRKNKQEVN